MNLPKISVHNRQRSRAVDIRGLQVFAEAALAECVRLKPRGASGLNGLAAIAVLLVSDRRIAELHRRFMKITGPTDVITFQHGEIFVSVDTAARHAKRFGAATLRELNLYIVHGLLHLHGFEDLTASARRQMNKMQEAIVERIG